MELAGVAHDGTSGKDCSDHGVVRVICGCKGDCVVIGLGLENTSKMVDGIWCADGRKKTDSSIG